MQLLDRVMELSRSRMDISPALNSIVKNYPQTLIQEIGTKPTRLARARNGPGKLARGWKYRFQIVEIMK